MALTEEQKVLFDALEVKRARDLDPSVLRAMRGPVVNGEEESHIIELFTSDTHLQDDLNGHLASFVIVSPQGLPLAFFSLRCGELFERVDVRHMTLGCGFYDEIVSCMNNSQLTEEQRKNEMRRIAIRMNDEGLSIDDVMQLSSKKQDFEADEALEADKDVTRVNVVHPAIEVKFFGTNAKALNYWESLGLTKDKKMGETLFWTKVVDTIRYMMNMVGCEYIYLFAADNEAEGGLVKYYRVRLNFGSNSKMSANKPRFDYTSQFLFQSVKDLFEKQKYFIDNF